MAKPSHNICLKSEKLTESGVSVRWHKVGVLVPTSSGFDVRLNAGVVLVDDDTLRAYPNGPKREEDDTCRET